ncbi:carbonic anhydrase [Allorhizobium sp. NPDC080224]|jgi:carbonic anhydrase|uniref:Carbonic anhydrase n=1 Tax=Rhizobium rosettiformans TaxID=1368430 RepID=A0ABX7ESQ6_9HYPH|nr:carbonic anhydrase [Rhizobium rosettiformans]ODS53989.1 MAG: carbonate dehydratase [Agrobacterium sp. SCN 61-19]QRF51005.1 carbonic anhydrase [Rhizobium rosettiformans]
MSQFPSALLNGYRNFMSGRYHDQRDRYRALAEQGQKPNTLVIACCDSRAAPEVIFDSIPGELFVVRNVANMVPPYEPDGQYHSTSAALEFAVQALRVQDIIVMGHGRCGGIRAALDPNAEPLSPGDFIGKWMNLVAPAAEQIQGNSTMTPAERQTALERISIRNSIANLRTFPCVKILEERGKLRIHGAWFDISNGELWVMDPKTKDFERLGAEPNN